MAQDVNRNLGPGKNGSFSYTSVGNAEDMLDLLINLDPIRTKFLSSFGRAKPAIQTDFSWWTERLRPPQDNAHLEKEEYKFYEIDSQEGLKNYIQHFQNSGFITDTENKIKKVFRRGSSEFAAAVERAIRGQGDDIEFMICTSKVANFENPGKTPARSGGIPYFLTTSEMAATFETSGHTVTLDDVSESKPIDLRTGDFVYFIATAMPTSLAANTPYYIHITEDGKALNNIFTLHNSLEDAVNNKNPIQFGSTGTSVKMIRRNVVSKAKEAFNLEDINTVLEMIYRRGGNGNQMYMSLRNKREFSKLINKQMTANRQGPSMGQYSDAATVYESDFGMVTAKAHHMYGNDRIDILDMQYWDLKYLNPTHEVQGLAKTGTYEKFVVETDVGVQATAPQASGAIINIGLSA